jgi:Domain of unknown function (DUF3330)
MTDKSKPKPATEPRVVCEVCLKEVPVSAAKSDEASDYVFYFCGSECHAKWRERKG